MKDAKFDPQAVEAFLRVLERKLSSKRKMNNAQEMSPVNTHKAKKQILLIDDDEHIYMSIKTIFKEQYQLYYAEDGRQGCEKAKMLKPDLIILDSRMPGLSGKETLSALREQDDQVPIVFLTAYPEDVFSQIGNIDSISCFITKPFDVNKLRKLVDNLTKNSEP